MSDFISVDDKVKEINESYNFFKAINSLVTEMQDGRLDFLSIVSISFYKDHRCLSEDLTFKSPEQMADLLSFIQEQNQKAADKLTQLLGGN